MKKIPLWGKITGGCFSIILLFVLIAGCAGIISAATSDPVASTEPVASQEESPSEETTAPDPVEEETTPEETAEPEAAEEEETSTPVPEKTEETTEPVEEDSPEPVDEPEAVEEEAPDTAVNEESGLPINTCISDIDNIMYDVIREFVYPEANIDRDSVYVVQESVENGNMYLVAGSDKGIIIFYVSETDGMAYAVTPAAYEYSDLVFAEDLGFTIPDSDAFHVAFSCAV